MWISQDKDFKKRGYWRPRDKDDKYYKHWGFWIYQNRHDMKAKVKRDGGQDKKFVK